MLTLAISFSSVWLLLLLGAVAFRFYGLFLVAGLEAMLLTVLCCSQRPGLYALCCRELPGGSDLTARDFLLDTLLGEVEQFTREGPYVLWPKLVLLSWMVRRPGKYGWELIMIMAGLLIALNILLTTGTRFMNNVTLHAFAMYLKCC